MSTARLFVGVQCDRPGDGIETVLVDVTGRSRTLRSRQRVHRTRPLDAELRDALRAPPEAAGAPDRVDLDLRLGAAMGEAVNELITEARAARDSITAVGVGGVRRAAGGSGAAGGHVDELGLPEAVAQAAGIPAVGRFGAADIATGGHGGAPAAWPIWRLLRHERLSRVLLHLGAVASLTFVGSDAAPADVVAYDVGPGPAAIDALARRAVDLPGDADGAGAARGRPEPAMVHELLTHPYLSQPPPKACTSEMFATGYLDRLEMVASRHGCRGEDLLATLTEAVAAMLVRAVGALTERPHEVILAGSGAGNIHLAGRIRDRFSPSSTYTVQRYGVGLRALSAVCYATLAAARIDGIAAHCPAAGGARRAAVLGSVSVP
ncbi:MAG: anhydro-N-acetylmuramic acid kinase [Phycisphaerae bacterium]|nr:anhydro-N-acetylmuramic acid kinase [Phycisphaerae bacterium]